MASAASHLRVEPGDRERKLADAVRLIREKCSLRFWGAITLRCQAGEIVVLEISETIKPGAKKTE